MKKTPHKSATEPSDVLADAIENAVQQGLIEAERLHMTVKATLEALAGTVGRLQDDPALGARTTFSNVAEMIQRVTAILTSRQLEIDRIFASQHEALGSVNLVLFGRTGAGKSSVVEALIRGNGASVSPDGRSDFTTEVEGRPWRGCRVQDTPGTQGWSKQRGDLEEKARRVAEIADIVLLAFDTQSQQAGEFDKIAQWVLAYRKPAIALLNVRNQTWRRPDRVGEAAARRSLSQSVREHRQRVVGELEGLGLPSVPLIAFNSQRAMFARTQDPYAGPGTDLRLKQRTSFGVSKLAALSNLTALEDLIAKTLEQSATALRLGMLRDEVRSLLLAANVELLEIADRLDIEIVQLDRFVESTLKVVGYPDSAARSAFAPPGRDSRQPDLLTQLEKARAEAFPPWGGSDLTT